MPVIAETDSPPGVPAYAAGAGAFVAQPQTAGAFRASGQTDLNQFLNPPLLPSRPSPSPTPFVPPTDAPTTLAGHAADLLKRATDGIKNIFGGTTVPTSTAITADPSRANKLEAGLNDLQKRSTTVIAPPNFYQMQRKLVASTNPTP
jgi:hypothetical protein